MPVQNEQQPGPALSDEYSAEWSEKKIFVQWLCISAWCRHKNTPRHAQRCTVQSHTRKFSYWQTTT